MLPEARSRGPRINSKCSVDSSDNSLNCPLLSPQRFGRHTQLIQRQRQLKVRERRMFRIDQMPPALQRPGSSTHQERRQWTMRVPVAVADAGAEQQDHMIQQ